MCLMRPECGGVCAPLVPSTPTWVIRSASHKGHEQLLAMHYCLLQEPEPNKSNQESGFQQIWCRSLHEPVDPALYCCR